MNLTDTALTSAIATVVGLVTAGVGGYAIRGLVRFGRELLGYLRTLSTLPAAVSTLQTSITDLSGRVSLLEHPNKEKTS